MGRRRPGLEIKRELVTGERRDPATARLPALAALGGMVFPAVLYLAVSGGGQALAFTWAGLVAAAKVGILDCSLAASLTGTAVLLSVGRPPRRAGRPRGWDDIR